MPDASTPTVHALSGPSLRSPAGEAAAAAERTRLLYSQTNAGSAASVAVAMGVACYFWAEVPRFTLALWLAGVLCVGAWRIHLTQRYHRAQAADAQLAPWHTRYLTGATASGLMFGCAWWLIAPHAEFQDHVLLAFAMGGMALGAVPLLGSSPVIQTLYSAAVCVPAVLWMLAQGNSSHLTMAVLGTAFFVAVLAAGRVHHRSLMKMMRLAAANRALHEHQVRLRDFAHMGADLFWEADPQGRYTYLSEGYEALTGIRADEMLGQPVTSPRGPCFVPGEQLDPESDAPVQQPFSDHALKWGTQGERVTVMLSSAVPIRADNGDFLGLRGTVRDITQQHQLAQELSHQASHDSLTDLANRRAFEQRLTQLLDRASALPDGPRHALCYLDLDQFKLVNDTCGHAAGDALLKQLSGVLRHRLRARDTLARLGGDEFAVLMENCTADDALVVAEGIRTTVESMRFQWEGSAFNLTTSIGVVSIDDHSVSAAEVMMAADAACYAAKDGGRNRVHVYKEQDEVLSRRHGEMQWVTRITHALETDRLALAAQPIAALNDRPGAPEAGLEHFEVLLRMRDDDQSLIAPNAFLPAAERYNLATRIDQWVIDRTFAWLMADSTRLAEVGTCCINLSGHSISDEGFQDNLRRRLAAHPGLGARLCFEFTETVAFSNLDRAVAFMNSLRRFGCRFALDDFGTGLSSFGYLKTLPVDYLKIDGVFVRGMVDDPVDLAMVRSIFEVARIMGKRTVAECVESEATLDLLRTLGVDHAQGHAVSRPRPLDDLGLRAPRPSNVVGIR